MKITKRRALEIYAELCPEDSVVLKYKRDPDRCGNSQRGGKMKTIADDILDKLKERKFDEARASFIAQRMHLLTVLCQRHREDILSVLSEEERVLFEATMKDLEIQGVVLKNVE